MARHSIHARVFRSIFDRKEVIRHRLVRELVNERDGDVHRAVSYDQRRALPPGVLFLFPRAHVSPPRFGVRMHARTGKSGFARLYSSSAAWTSNARTRDSTSASAASNWRA
jgi:hypothetical protein